MIDKGYWSTTGATPSATVGARIYEDMKDNGVASRFRKASRGMFTLAKTVTSDRQEFQHPSRSITVTVPPLVQVGAGEEELFTVKVTRENVEGAVQVSFEAPAGVTLHEFTIGADQREREASVVADVRAKGKYRTISFSSRTPRAGEPCTRWSASRAPADKKPCRRGCVWHRDFFPMREPLETLGEAFLEHGRASRLRACEAVRTIAERASRPRT